MPLRPRVHMNATPAFVFSDPRYWIAFGFGSGLAGRAPGTVGTLVAIPIYVGMQLWLSPLLYGLMTVVLFVLGVWVCGQTARALGVHDHAGIVWDEIVGYLLAMSFAPFGIVWVMAGFVLFRIFDIMKPWPIGVVDRRVGGGLGIMLDDALAAVYTALVMYLAQVSLA